MTGTKENSRIRVLVADDSALMGRQIVEILRADEEIVVIGLAKDGMEAVEMVGALKPDVVTLDVEMPRMNGITALKHIMIRYAVPTVMISALTKEGARTSFDALRYGAIDIVAKPSRRDDGNLEKQKSDIIAKVKRAAEIRSGRVRYMKTAVPPTRDKKAGEKFDAETRLIGVGAGTGGYYSLLRLIPALPAEFRDILIAMLLVPARYVDPFVAYLDEHSQVPVRTIRQATPLRKGVCHVCAGQEGAELARDLFGDLLIKPCPAPASHRGGLVDLMLGSFAQLGRRAVGVVMTGAGRDGALGMRAIRDSGGITVVQDINNAVDPSMPLAVLENGPVEKILPDHRIAEFLGKLHHS
jgi:two-component system, chemotaxis family, protein-glutamate methylesterase/glutaminase